MQNCELHDTYGKRIDALEANYTEFERRLSSLETEVAVSGDRIHRIFDDMEELKGLIKAIAEKIDHIKGKPAERWENLVNILIAAGAGAVLTLLLQLWE